MTALEALNLAAPLADTYNSVEHRLLTAIARQLSLNDTHELNEVSKWQIKRLARLGMLRKDAARIIAAGTKGVPSDFADTVQQAITSALAEDELTDMWQNEGFAESAKNAVKHYRNQAKDVYNQVNTVMKYKAESSFVNAVNSVADKWNAEMRRQQAEIADKQGFLDILNSNTADVVNGSAARTKAVRTTIHEMAQKGIPAFVDRAGREWSPEAYVNMDIRATVKNTALEAKFSVMDSLGQDVFEVSSHPGSRPKCRPWQGKLISRSGKTTDITDLHGRKHKVIPLSQTSFGEPDGLFGINCGHRPRGCSEGVFTRSAVEYDDAEDKELYNKVCRQRELERGVRKSKTEADMLEAAGDTEGARAVRQKMSEQNKALRAYCEDNGLKFRSDRVKTYGAIAPKKTLDKSGESGIMKMGKASGSNAQMPPDFSKYNVVDDPDGVLKLKSFISAELHVSEKNIDISKLRNAEVAKPFMERLKKIQTECGLSMPRIVATDIIDGDECCIAGFKPFENTFYISSRYFNSKDAFLDTLRDWAKKGFMPKQCTSIKYVAEHEAAHIRLPSDVITSEEAKKIFKKRKLLNDNDAKINEYYADAVAIFRTSNEPDGNVVKAIEYLRERGIVI